jgi:UDP-N-acetylmuramate--alanine ligase
MLDSPKRIHFIGVGGIGMSGIAWLCLKKGHKITGSDIKPSSIIDKLVFEGADISIGHRWENIKDVDMVVYSSAVLAHNPELSEATRRALPIFKRGEFLKYLAEGKKYIAVTGAHGKTTTSSMVSTILQGAGLFPSGIVGALVPHLNGNAFIGDGEYFVAEADESDGSFLYLEPDYEVITNIDMEHLDYYIDIDQIKNAYLKFINNMKQDGTLICCGQDPYIKKILKNTKAKVLKYGMSKGNTLYAKNIKLHAFESEFDCVYENRDIGRFRLSVPGEHNILNGMGAILTALCIGVNPESIRSSICEYKGAERRFQEKACIDGIKIIDDYAHHPTEIRATLKAARNINCKRIISVFQPHRFTRTKFLKKEFAQSFSDTDCLVLTDIYPANEKPIFGVTSLVIYNEVLKIKKINVNYIVKEKIIDYLLNFVRPGDLLLFLGAGDIGKISGEFISRLKTIRENEFKTQDKSYII